MCSCQAEHALLRKKCYIQASFLPKILSIPVLTCQNQWQKTYSFEYNAYTHKYHKLDLLKAYLHVQVEINHCKILLLHCLSPFLIKETKKNK